MSKTIKVKVITPPAANVPKASHIEFIQNDYEGIKEAVRGDFEVYHMGKASWVAFYDPNARNEFDRPTHRFWDIELHGRVVIAGIDGDEYSELAFQTERDMRKAFPGIWG